MQSHSDPPQGDLTLARERRIERLEMEVETLRAELRRRRLPDVSLDTAALEPVDVPPAWARELTDQQWALLCALAKAYPRAVTIGSLADSLPRLDRNQDHDDHGADQVILKVRRKLGADAVETIRPGGRRLGDRLARLMRPDTITATQREREQQGEAA